MKNKNVICLIQINKWRKKTNNNKKYPPMRCFILKVQFEWLNIPYHYLSHRWVYIRALLEIEKSHWWNEMMLHKWSVGFNNEVYRLERFDYVFQDFLVNSVIKGDKFLIPVRTDNIYETWKLFKTIWTNLPNTSTLKSANLFWTVEKLKEKKSKHCVRIYSRSKNEPIHIFGTATVGKWIIPIVKIVRRI